MNLRNILLIGTINLTIFNNAITLADNLPTNNKNYYIQLNAGYAHGQEPKKDFIQNSMGNTGLYGIEAGYRINEHFRTSLSLDYRPNYKNNYSTYEKFTTPEEEVVITTNYSTKVKSLATMLNIYYDIKEVNHFTPYLLLGAGVAFNETNSTTTRSNSITSIHEIYAKSTHHNFAYKAGLGIRYSTNNNIDFDLHYQYVDLGKFKTSTSSCQMGKSYDAPAKIGKLQSQEVILGIVYKF